MQLCTNYDPGATVAIATLLSFAYFYLQMYCLLNGILK